MSSSLTTFIWVTLVRCLCGVTNWPIGGSMLSTADYGFAVGSYARNLSFIGGHYRPTGLTTYIVDSDTFIEEDIASSPLTVNISGINQFYTQRENTLYMLSQHSTSDISSYNLETRSFTASLVSLPLDIGSFGCLTSSDDHLFIVGGAVSIGSPYDTLQVLTFASTAWLSSAPSMTTSRAAHTCVVHQGYLWALGGYSGGFLQSTERISITDIAQNTWDASTTPELLDPVLNARAISHKELIFIIAGLKATALVNTVQVINTRNGEDTVTNDHVLGYAVDGTGAIWYDGFVYAFGGRTEYDPLEAIAMFSYFDTSTSDPTKYPTKAPTRMPSGSPTKGPTNMPTNAPSSATSQPSSAPTKTETTKDPNAETTEDGMPQGGNKAKETADTLTILIVGGVVVLVILVVVGLKIQSKKDKQFNEEVQVQNMVRQELEEEHKKNVEYHEQVEAVVAQQTQYGMSEKDVMRQVMAMSALEANETKRRQSLQVSDLPSPRKAPKKRSPAGNLGSVEEKEQKEDEEVMHKVAAVAPAAALVADTQEDELLPGYDDDDEKDTGAIAAAASDDEVADAIAQMTTAGDESVAKPIETKDADITLEMITNPANKESKEEEGNENESENKSESEDVDKEKS